MDRKEQMEALVKDINNATEEERKTESFKLMQDELDWLRGVVPPWLYKESIWENGSI